MEIPHNCPHCGRNLITNWNFGTVGVCGCEAAAAERKAERAADYELRAAKTAVETAKTAVELETAEARLTEAKRSE